MAKGPVDTPFKEAVLKNHGLESDFTGVAKVEGDANFPMVIGLKISSEPRDLFAEIRGLD